jgi:hypothetical protein
MIAFGVDQRQEFGRHPLRTRRAGHEDIEQAAVSAVIPDFVDGQAPDVSVNLSATTISSLSSGGSSWIRKEAALWEISRHSWRFDRRADRTNQGVGQVDRLRSD